MKKLINLKTLQPYFQTMKKKIVMKALKWGKNPKMEKKIHKEKGATSIYYRKDHKTQEDRAVLIPIARIPKKWASKIK